MISWHCSRTYKFSHLSTAEFFPLFGIVRTYLCARITSTLLAVIKGWKGYWFNFQVWVFIKYPLRGQRFIIVANTRVVPTNNEVCAPKVLAHYCMMNCLPRASISHLCMKGNKHRTSARIITIKKGFIGMKYYFILKVS